jgi:transposase
MESISKPNIQTQRRHPPELRERAVRVVKEAIAQAGGGRHGVVTRVAIQLGMGSETLRHWVMQAEVDEGQPIGGP